MASWQYDVYLIPRSKLIEIYSAVPENVDIQLFEGTLWWKDYQLPQQYEETLNQCLPKNRPWLSDCIEWGTEDGNRVSIGFTDGNVEWIWVRFDVRSLCQALIDCLVDFAALLDCLMLLKDNLKLIEPSRKHLLKEMETSTAAKFVANPREYFDDLANFDSQPPS